MNTSRFSQAYYIGVISLHPSWDSYLLEANGYYLFLATYWHDAGVATYCGQLQQDKGSSVAQKQDALDRSMRWSSHLHRC